MLAIFAIVVLAAVFLCAIAVARHTSRLPGRPTLAFQFYENGKVTTIYVYDDKHWLVRATFDDLIARKPKVVDADPQNVPPAASNDNSEGKSQG
ncbi:hypothetical protein CNMCM5793_005606 [Aspergillus hiratsukae]|uniref:Uncharacterized protein n=1 Tax=Aspergillus hiratsukae TaxID=1194566 RepID=A0A8H6PH33_9EURO|nr:hypothetical protein CNMCM5793_005606 [Aspergillus hiratsukae]KAF7171834.1 hypothetical protein CNMCM6106_006172 [Aspergillus hiratsukae]